MRRSRAAPQHQRGFPPGHGPPHGAAPADARAAAPPVLRQNLAHQRAGPGLDQPFRRAQTESFRRGLGENQPHPRCAIHQRRPGGAVEIQRGQHRHQALQTAQQAAAARTHEADGGVEARGLCRGRLSPHLSQSPARVPCARFHQRGNDQCGRASHQQQRGTGRRGVVDGQQAGRGARLDAHRD